MKNIFAAILPFALSTSAVADIYKCPDGNGHFTYANTSETRGPEELIAKGCQRLGLTTDPVSNTGSQEVVVKRRADGHFWLNGQINGKPVVFIVDTGATLVTVSDEFAASANLKGGYPVVVHTAGGKRLVRVIDDVAVTAAIFTAPEVKVSVGLSGFGPNEALLGQSFLSQFEVTLDDRQMIMRNKKR